jgi:hypothetical protein
MPAVVIHSGESAPAMSDSATACGRGKLSVTARIPDRSSVKITPVNGGAPYPRPSRSRRYAAGDRDAGRSTPVRPGTCWCPSIIPAPGVRASSANGLRSCGTSWSSGGTVTDWWWLSPDERPWPGKCLKTGVTPASSSPEANARA